MQTDGLGSFSVSSVTDGVTVAFGSLVSLALEVSFNLS